MVKDDRKLGGSLIYFTWVSWGLFQSKAAFEGRFAEGNEMQSVVEAVGTTAQMWYCVSRPTSCLELESDANCSCRKNPETLRSFVTSLCITITNPQRLWF